MSKGQKKCKPRSYFLMATLPKERIVQSRNLRIIVAGINEEIKNQKSTTTPPRSYYLMQTTEKGSEKAVDCYSLKGIKEAVIIQANSK